MTADTDRIHIIGVGSDGLGGLTAHAMDLVQSAELVVGSENSLAFATEVQAEKHTIGTDLQSIVQLLESNLGQKRMVVLATGDPLFYGTARYLCNRVGKDHFEVLPHVSSMQLAFARIKESWEEAYLTNLATHPIEDVIDRIRTAETVGLFTSDEGSPPRIARQLIDQDITYFRAYVCENLGSPDERVTQGELADIAEMEFSPLNVMILQRKPDRPDLQKKAGRFRQFGNPDDVFAQSRPKSGLITQAEVRAVALSELDLLPTSTVWDIGAGSGSVSVEAAHIAAEGTIYAIEQDAADYHLILVNTEAFGVGNVRAVHGAAPDVFSELPTPDAVFIGGTGKETARLIEAAFERLAEGGRLVANVATLETLNVAYETLKRLARHVEVTMFQVSRGVAQLETLRFEAANPTFLLRVTKPGP